MIIKLLLLTHSHIAIVGKNLAFIISLIVSNNKSFSVKDNKLLYILFSVNILLQIKHVNTFPYSIQKFGILLKIENNPDTKPISQNINASINFHFVSITPEIISIFSININY